MVEFEQAFSEMDSQSNGERLWESHKTVAFHRTTIGKVCLYAGLVRRHATCIVYNKMKDGSDKIDLYLLTRSLWLSQSFGIQYGKFLECYRLLLQHL